METGTVQINAAPARGPDHFPFQVKRAWAAWAALRRTGCTGLLRGTVPRIGAVCYQMFYLLSPVYLLVISCLLTFVALPS